MPGIFTDAVDNQSRTDMREDDKSQNGHRFDTIPLANGIIKAGAQCDVIKFDPEEFDNFKQQCQATNRLRLPKALVFLVYPFEK